MNRPPKKVPDGSMGKPKESPAQGLDLAKNSPQARARLILQTEKDFLKVMQAAYQVFLDEGKSLQKAADLVGYAGSHLLGLLNAYEIHCARNGVPDGGPEPVYSFVEKSIHLVKESPWDQIPQSISRAIYERRLTGVSPAAIAEEFAMNIAEVNRLLHRRAQDNLYQMDALRTTSFDIDLSRIDALLGAHWQLAMGGDIDSANIIIRLMERRAKMTGYDAPTRTENANLNIHTDLNGANGLDFSKLSTEELRQYHSLQAKATKVVEQSADLPQGPVEVRVITPLTPQAPVGEGDPGKKAKTETRTLPGVILDGLEG